MATVPEFPLTYTDDEGDVQSLFSQRDVEQAIEFLNDDDPPYVCFDVTGARVRLILWQLELVVCQVVSPSWDTSRVRILREVGGAPTSVKLYETFEGVVLRRLVTEGTTRSAEPSPWDAPIILDDSAHLEPTSIHYAEFHKTWMKQRLSGDWIG